MANNKISVRNTEPSYVSGEATAFRFNSATDTPQWVSVSDTVYPARRMEQCVKVALNGTTMHAASGGVVAWQVPAASDIIVTRVIIDITTVATGACTLDIGYTAVSAATTSDTMLDGIDANAATAVFDSMNAALDSGANAKAQKCAASKWITIDEKTGDSTGMIAQLYIFYYAI